MKINKLGFFHAILIVLSVPVFAQDRSGGSTIQRLQAGVDYYERGLLYEATGELRYVEKETTSEAQRAEALFWLGITQISAREYEAALKDLQTLERLNSQNRRNKYVPYYMGLALFYLNKFDESIVQFAKFRGNPPDEANGIPGSTSETLEESALFWIGECLFSMDQLDEAEAIFTLIVEEYPTSYKYEAAYYRIALISQKRVESELLSLLSWTHEESLKTIEEYQRREHSYEQAVIAYQKRIADLLKETRLSDLENENARYREQFIVYDQLIQELENELRNAQGGQPSGARTNSRLSILRETAVDLRNQIIKSEGNE